MGAAGVLGALGSVAPSAFATATADQPAAGQPRPAGPAEFARPAADGTLISETRSVGIRIYKQGQWGSAGGLGQVTHHDRSSSRG